jgi:hypothetical protein
MEQFGHVLFGEQQGIAGEKLIAIQHYKRVLQFNDAQIALVFPATAHGTFVN